MATPKTGGKVLRIGIVQEEQIVQEQLIRRPENVTVGESTKNTFVLPPCSLPKRFPLFVAKGSSYFLQFTDGMIGKVSIKGRIQSLDDLKTSGEAVRRGGTWVLPVQESSRGKVVIDGISVLFQFVPAPPQVLTRAIQMDFRPRFIEDDDPVFYGFLALFAALATSLAIYAHSADYTLEDRYQGSTPIAKLLNAPAPEEEPEPEKDPEPVEERESSDEGLEKAAEPEEQEPVETKPKPQKTELEKQIEESIKIEEEDREVEALVAQMMGTVGQGRGTTVGNIEDDPVDLEAMAGRLGEMETTTNRKSRKGEAGNREGIEIDGVAKKEVGSTKLSDGPEQVVKGDISLGSADVDVESGEAGGVTSVIKDKRGRIKQCYELQLRNNPSLEGKVTIYFEVGRGRVLEADVIENTTRNDTLARCIKGKIEKLRFDKTVEASVEYPFVFSPQE